MFYRLVGSVVPEFDEQGLPDNSYVPIFQYNFILNKTRLRYQCLRDMHFSLHHVH
jgi:hypothetical protein